MELLIFFLILPVQIFLGINFINHYVRTFPKSKELFSLKANIVYGVVLILINISIFLVQNNSPSVLIFFSFLLYFTLTASTIDILCKEIPDTISFLILVIGILYSFTLTGFFGVVESFKNSLLLVSPLLLIYFYGDNFMDETIGLGDIKVILGLGCFESMNFLKGLVFYEVIYLSGIVYILFLKFILRQKILKGSNISFMPFITLGALYFVMN